MVDSAKPAMNLMVVEVLEIEILKRNSYGNLYGRSNKCRIRELLKIGWLIIENWTNNIYSGYLNFGLTNTGMVNKNKFSSDQYVDIDNKMIRGIA